MASTKTTVKTIRLTNETADFFEGKPLNRYVECLHSLIESGKVKMDGDSLRVTGKKGDLTSIYDKVPPEVTANFADLDDLLEGGVAGLMVAVNNMIEDGLLNTDYSICGEPWVERFRDACNAKGLKVENVSEKAILALQKGDL